MLDTLFLFLLLVVMYTYAGYGMLLYAINKVKRILRPVSQFVPMLEADIPAVTLIIPAYNEEAYIKTKILNTLALKFPPGKLTIMIVTDGSTDNTPKIVQEFPQVTLMHSDERRGKVAAINRVMQFVETPVVVFTDANTHLNKMAVYNIVRHYADERVGAVSGEKRVAHDHAQQHAAATEGLYWKYESFLKKMDSEFYTVVGAAGELFSIRTALYSQVEEDTLLDDFMISLRICSKGYRVVYEPDAFATESPSASIAEEQKRKTRISAGGFQSMARLMPLLNIFKYPRLAFLYISHRVLRWAICPFLLPIIFILNGWLAFNPGGAMYVSMFAAQCLLYLMAAKGWQLSARNREAGIFKVPFYFLFMNMNLYIGLGKYMRNNQSVNWDKAQRLG